MLAFAAIAETAIAGVRATAGVEFFIPLVSFTLTAPAITPAAGVTFDIALESFTLTAAAIEPGARRRRQRMAVMTV